MQVLGNRSGPKPLLDHFTDVSNAVTPAMAGPGFADPAGPFHPSALSSHTGFSGLLMILIGLESPGQLPSSPASLPPAAGMGGPRHGSGMRVPVPQHPAALLVTPAPAQPDQPQEPHFWGTGPLCPSLATSHVGEHPSLATPQPSTGSPPTAHPGPQRPPSLAHSVPRRRHRRCG